MISQEFIHVHVRDVSVLWSNMFKIMEDIRDRFSSVEDYSISETSLEQVFISFAKNQKTTTTGEKVKMSKKKQLANDDCDDTLPVQQTKLARYLSTASRASEKCDTSDNSQMCDNKV